MPAGIEIYDSQNNVILSMTDNVVRFLGQISTSPPNSGSVSDPQLDPNTYFYTLIPTAGSFTIGGQAASDYQPQVNVSGNTLSWSYPSGGGQATIILYGTYS